MVLCGCGMNGMTTTKIKGWSSFSLAGQDHIMVPTTKIHEVHCFGGATNSRVVVF